ncbi:MAG TPA: ABC transporter permease [Kiritimatiellia bacterium]|nr:ABC transporter permease [Kiritimatiellia bacterium]
MSSPDTTPLSASSTVEIRAYKGLVPLGLRELWNYRDLIYFFLWRDIKGRYRQMALGPLWIIIHPLLNMFIFTLIFGMVAKLPSDGIPYPIFNYAALLPWGFFGGALFAAANSLLSYRNLISKVYFPRLVAPVVGVLSGLVDLGISFLVFLGMMWWYGFPLTLAVLWLPVYLLLAAMTALAVGLWMASWIVHFHDVADMLSYAVKFWMYATPIVYATSMIPVRWQAVYRLNPMTNVVEGFRWALCGAGDPSFKMLGISFLVVTPILISGAYYFRKTERSIVDIA